MQDPPSAGSCSSVPHSRDLRVPRQEVVRPSDHGRICIFPGSTSRSGGGTGGLEIEGAESRPPNVLSQPCSRPPSALNQEAVGRLSFSKADQRDGHYTTGNTAGGGAAFLRIKRHLPLSSVLASRCGSALSLGHQAVVSAFLSRRRPPSPTTVSSRTTPHPKMAHFAVPVPSKEPWDVIRSSPVPCAVLRHRSGYEPSARSGPALPERPDLVRKNSRSAYRTEPCSRPPLLCCLAAGFQPKAPRLRWLGASAVAGSPASSRRPEGAQANGPTASAFAKAVIDLAWCSLATSRPLRSAVTISAGSGPLRTQRQTTAGSRTQARRNLDDGRSIWKCRRRHIAGRLFFGNAHNPECRCRSG